MILVFMGGPGSGKSTVGKRLAEDLKWPWISLGEILRQSKEPWVIERLKTAQLFDDEMSTNLLYSQLSGVKDVIIDAFPRTLRQAELMVERNIKPDLVVEMVVPLEEVKQRLALRGREQDSEAVIEERYAMYEQSKTEILAYLVGNGAKAIAVNGVGTQDEVYRRAVLNIKEAITK
jgi:adenylate kinase